MAYKYDLTVLVISYNPNYGKLMRTLRSAILQKGVHHQIVVADDGSKNNYFAEVEELFRRHHFTDYVLVKNLENIGITMNFYSGLVKAEGEFLKGISPGDYLYAQDTLEKWLAFVREHQLDASFGDAVYFNLEDDQIVTFPKIISRPKTRFLLSVNHYDEYNSKVNVWANADHILGAVYFTKTALVKQYCEPLLGKVKYMEDVLYRIMLLDGIHTVYYPANVMMYEFGTGVSTSMDPKWRKIIADEKTTIVQLLEESGRTDLFTKKLIPFLKHNPGNQKNLQRFMLIARYFPTAALWVIRRSIMIRMGKCYADTAFDQKFMEEIRE